MIQYQYKKRCISSGPWAGGSVDSYKPPLEINQFFLYLGPQFISFKIDSCRISILRHILINYVCHFRPHYSYNYLIFNYDWFLIYSVITIKIRKHFCVTQLSVLQNRPLSCNIFHVYVNDDYSARSHMGIDGGISTLQQHFVIGLHFGGLD